MWAMWAYPKKSVAQHHGVRVCAPTYILLYAYTVVYNYSITNYYYYLNYPTKHISQ